jgi:hypothetical protein
MPAQVSNGSRIPAALQLGILALLDAGYSIIRISRESKVNVKTIAGIRDNTELREKFRISGELDDCKKRLQARYFREAHRSLDNIDQAKLDKASAYQLMGMSCLAASKGMDMENQASGTCALNFSVLIQNSYQGDDNRSKVIDVTDVKSLDNKG